MTDRSGLSADHEPKDQRARRGNTFLQTARTVAWSFFGVRKSVDHERDVGQLNPVHVVIVGVLGAVLFVVLLITLVSWVVGSGVAR